MKKSQAILFAAGLVGSSLMFASPATAAPGDYVAIASSKEHRVNIAERSRVSTDDAQEVALDACRQLTDNATDCKALAWGAAPICIVVVQDSDGDAAGGFGETFEAAIAKAYEYAAQDNFPLAPDSPIVQKACV